MTRVAVLRAGLLALVILAPWGEVVAQDADRVAAPSQRHDPLAKYRRGDGTLDWRLLTRSHALSEAGGRAQFGIDLFLREIAVVAKTGDRSRIEEFFDGLLATDFYERYGLFVAGGRLSEVAYARHLQRYIKPRFVNSVLKTNLVLAAGIALPQIVGGTAKGKTFAISLSSLGLSSAAVKAGVTGLSWVLPLKKAGDVGMLARMGLYAKRMAKVGGWIYTVAELAVILYVAEEIETRISAHLERRKARRALVAAGQAFVDAAAIAVTEAALAEAADAYHLAWIEYRNSLYRPLHVDEALFARRLVGLARRAKLIADERLATIERVGSYPTLRLNLERRYGSLEAYAAYLARYDEAKLEVEVEAAFGEYDTTRTQHLGQIYNTRRRGAPLLGEVEHIDWLLDGAPVGTDDDPAEGRHDVFARWTRSRARASLAQALAGASRNRIEAYDDELEVVAAVSRSLRRRGRADLASQLDDRTIAIQRLKSADAELSRVNRRRVGLTGRLRRR